MDNAFVTTDLDTLLKSALAYLQQGNLQETERICKEILATWPEASEAFHLLGLAAFHLRDMVTAIQFFQQAIAYRPDNAAYHNNLGVAFQEIGRAQAAIDQYQIVLQLNPAHAQACTNIAIILEHLGQLPDAVHYYEKALSINASIPEVYVGLGNISKVQQNWDVAIQYYQRALQLNPNAVDAYVQLGNIYIKYCQFPAAESCFQNALQLNPNHAQAHSDLSAVLKELRRLDEALSHAEQAVALDPNMIEAHNNLGSILLEKKQYQAAKAAIEKAIRLNPNFAIAYNNYGIAAASLGQLDEGIEAYEKAIHLDSSLGATYSNLGNVWLEKNVPQKAIEYYEKALAILPAEGQAVPHINMGLAWLMLNDYEKGWPEYEWRVKHYYPNALQGMAWEGHSLKGKTLLIASEQGFGDTFQCLRYLPLIKQQGARITMLCAEETYPLLKYCASVDKVLIESKTDAKTLEYDCYAYMLSLPAIFKTLPDTIPGISPTLFRLPKEILQKWKKRFKRDKGLKIGVVWFSDSRNPSSAKRSCPLKQFSQLINTAETTFYSLQKGSATEDIQAEGLSIINLDSDIHVFTDTAAAIENLDLVITIDSAVAHLAGILGKPVWILLPFSADWRWGLNTAESAWYPTARLFRQAAPGDWESVFDQVKSALIEHQTKLTNKK